MSKYIEVMGVGSIGENNLGQKYKVLELLEGRRAIIKFLETGYEANVFRSNLTSGRVKDRYQATVHGKGVLGDFRPYDDPDYHKIYTHWAHMIRRCYDTTFKQFNNYGGEGVTVSERWIRFDHFYDDFKKLDGYSEEIMKLKLFRHLDKDIKQQHIPNSQRVYSLETCCLVTKEENEVYKREEERPYRKAINPAGTMFYFNHTQDFAKATEQLIRTKYIYLCVSGEKENHLGWKFYEATKEEYDEFHRLNPNTPEYPAKEDLIIIPSSWTKITKDYIQVFDSKIHKPNYNQILPEVSEA